jgi:hypothetical protein
MSDRDQNIKLYVEGAKRFFPNIKFSSAHSLFSGSSKKPSSGIIELDYSFIKKEFFSDRDKQTFIHYTSIDSLFNILNTSNVRLYNCIKSNDKREIEYGLRNANFDYSDELVYNLKKSHFILSGTLSQMSKLEDFNLWRLYGKDGYGAALEFEVDRKINKWIGITCGKVDYGNRSDKSNNISGFLKYHMDFQDKYKLFQNLPSIIPMLALFVKNEIWSIENEFRIVASCQYKFHNLEVKEFESESNPVLNSSLFHEVNPFGEIVSFLNLPITLNGINNTIVESPFQKGKFYNTIDYNPNLILKKVIFGPNVNKRMLEKSIITYFENVVPQKLGYYVDYSFSEILK